MEESLNEVIIKTQQNCNLLQVEIKKYQKILLELESGEVKIQVFAGIKFLFL